MSMEDGSTVASIFWCYNIFFGGVYSGLMPTGLVFIHAH